MRETCKFFFHSQKKIIIIASLYIIGIARFMQKKTLTKIRALDEQIGAKKSREIFKTKNWLNIQRKVSYCLHLNLTF